jgi:alkylhydroperoxidase family enzyme
MAERRQLGLAAAIAAVTGQSIALGIFLTPATMAKSLGSPLLLGAVWCAMAGMMVCGALCYAELAVRFPEAGGEYVYLRRGYGMRAAFLYGWMSAAVMDPGLAAALAVIAAGGGSLAKLLPLAERRTGSGPLLPAIAGALVDGTHQTSRRPARNYRRIPPGNREVKRDLQQVGISDKLKALLKIAGLVRQDGKLVTPEDVERAREAGATDLEIHDTVLIAAAFSMYNRYVDGLDTWQPKDTKLYAAMGEQLAAHGYLTLPAPDGLHP